MAEELVVEINVKRKYMEEKLIYLVWMLTIAVKSCLLLLYVVICCQIVVQCCHEK